VKSEEDAFGKRVGRIGILEGVERRERICKDYKFAIGWAFR